MGIICSIFFLIQLLELFFFLVFLDKYKLTFTEVWKKIWHEHDWSHIEYVNAYDVALEILNENYPELKAIENLESKSIELLIKRMGYFSGDNSRRYCTICNEIIDPKQEMKKRMLQIAQDYFKGQEILKKLNQEKSK